MRREKKKNDGWGMPLAEENDSFVWYQCGYAV